MKKIAILTGGGDCPGLNAVIRAIVKTAKKNLLTAEILTFDHYNTTIDNISIL